MVDLYYEWLLEGINDDRIDGHTKLLRYLYNTTFYVSNNVELDESRIKDGLDLRYVYLDNKTSALPFNTIFNLDVSVLEVLIALALKCENQIMYDPDMGNRVPVWFWMFLDNIGLLYFTDSEWNEELVSRTIFTWLSREYDRTGQGGLFPLREPYEDQREVPLWNQLNTYIIENF